MEVELAGGASQGFVDRPRAGIAGSDLGARAAGDGIAGDGHHAILRVEAGGQR